MYANPNIATAIVQANTGRVECRQQAILSCDEGYDYAVEKAGSTRGWTFTIYDEAYNYGFHQEMDHFVDCVLHDKQPLVTGEDGRAVLEVLFAAYESARTGCKVELPFQTNAEKPFDLWRPSVE